MSLGASGSSCALVAAVGVDGEGSGDLAVVAWDVESFRMAVSEPERATSSPPDNAEEPGPT